MSPPPDPDRGADQAAIGEPVGSESRPIHGSADGPADRTADDGPLLALLAAVPHLVVQADMIVSVSDAVHDELGLDAELLLGPLEDIGTRLDDASFDELRDGQALIRVRLGAELADHPIRLRRLAADGDRVWLEVRSMANEFRMESLLRRSGTGHMLLSPKVELEWSMSSNDLASVLPGDDPMNWVELMDPDDMQALGTAIFQVGADPHIRRTVSHRLNADRTYMIIDEVESAMHDPDLRAVLVRSRLADNGGHDTRGAVAPFAGITMSDHMPIGVIIASLAGKVLHRNAVAAELVGARVGQLVVPHGDEPWLMGLLGHDQSAEYQSVFAAACAGRSAHCTVASPFEPRRWLRMSISPAAASTVVFTIEDTTELAEAERALRASNRLLEALDSHSEELVIVFDALGRSRYTSSSAHRRFGLDTTVENVDEIVDLVHASDRQVVADLIRDVRSTPSASDHIDVRVERSDSDVARWHHATMTNLLDDPDVQGVVLTLRDVHERHLGDSELHFRATHDALTTLPDRAALQTRLDALLPGAAPVNGRTALVFCDIDNFKLINDQAGHRVGDLVLTAVADRLRSALRASDFVGRFGGDEFVIVAPDVNDEAHAVDVAERMFAAVTGPTRCDDIDVDVSVSMGVAITDDECTTAAGLLRRADDAMYDAKRRGRGRVSLYARGHTAVGGGVEPRNLDLLAAIDSRQLMLHYQPMVPLKDGLDRGYESLARWQHPTRGMIDAAQLLGNAEVSGLTARLGHELIRLVCDDERPWFAGEQGFVSVNLSASQLSYPDAASAFLERMEPRRADGQHFAIELTEAAFAQGPIVQSNLDRFRAADVAIFLDDFGVGYSSLSHLHRFPVDGLKIDASVINPTVDQNLVRLIVGVASTLGIRTIAEGVETTEQLDIVTRLGVDYAQGFLLGRPARTPVVRPAR